MPKAEADLIRGLYKQSVADYANLHSQVNSSPLGITSARALVSANTRNKASSSHSPQPLETAATATSTTPVIAGTSDISRRHLHDAESIFLSALAEAGSVRTAKERTGSEGGPPNSDGALGPGTGAPTEDFIRLNRLLANIPYNAALNSKLTPRDPPSSVTRSPQSHPRWSCRETGPKSCPERPTSAPSMRARRDSHALDRLAEKLHAVTNELMQERQHRAELETRLLQSSEAMFRAAYSQARVMVLIELREALLSALTRTTGELPDVLSDLLRGLA